MDKFLDNIKGNASIKTKVEARMMAPLVLAYIGDSIYEVFVRNYLVNEMDVSVHQYHKRATKYVRAEAQAKIVHALESELTEDEWTIVKRGRNQKSATVPKNANLTDYKYATGFEALLGYLFYIGDQARLVEIMSRSVEIMNKDMNFKGGNTENGK